MRDIDRAIVRWLGGDTGHPVAGLPVKQVHGVAHFREAQKPERSSFIISQSRDGIWMEGLSPFAFHDYPEYGTPSKKNTKTDVLRI